MYGGYSIPNPQQDMYSFLRQPLSLSLGTLHQRPLRSHGLELVVPLPSQTNPPRLIRRPPEAQELVLAKNPQSAFERPELVDSVRWIGGEIQWEDRNGLWNYRTQSLAPAILR